MIAARIAAMGRGFLYLALVSLAVMHPPLRIASLQAIPTDAIAALAGLCWGVAALIDARYRRWDRLFALLIDDGRGGAVRRTALRPFRGTAGGRGLSPRNARAGPGAAG